MRHVCARATATTLTALFPTVVLNASLPNEPSGSWDSIHVFEAAERGRQAHYKLTSTIMLQMTNRSIAAAGKDERSKESSAGDASREGEVLLSGSMTRQVGCFHVIEFNQLNCHTRCRANRITLCTTKPRTYRTRGR